MTCSERRCSTYHEPRWMVFRITMGLNLKSPRRNKPSDILEWSTPRRILDRVQNWSNCQIVSIVSIPKSLWMLGYKSASKADAMAPNVTPAISVYCMPAPHRNAVNVNALVFSPANGSALACDSFSHVLPLVHSDRSASTFEETTPVLFCLARRGGPTSASW